MFSLTVRVDDSERDLLLADLWEAGAAGITEEPDSLRAFFGPEADQKLLLRRFADFTPTAAEEEEIDYLAAEELRRSHRRTRHHAA